MRFAAILGVKDEIELLPSVIDHLLRIGVESIIARDNDSTDGSREYLAERAGSFLRLEPLSREEESSDALWAEREGALARSSGADWVLFLDADEFWLPASGSLHDCHEFSDSRIEKIIVPRFNVVPTGAAAAEPPHPVPDAYGGVNLIVAVPAPDFRVHMERNPSVPWITGIPMPKTAVRAARAGVVDLGHHDIRGMDGIPLVERHAENLLIAHYPFTTRARFQRKVDNIRRLLQQHPGIFPGAAGWHWKRWARIADDAGALDAEYQRQIFSVPQVRAMQASGVVRDAASVLAGQQSASAGIAETA